MWERLSRDPAVQIYTKSRQITCDIRARQQHHRDMLHQPPHSRDLRKGRVSQKGRIYIVTTRCHLRRQLFVDLHVGQIVSDEIDRSDREAHTETIAYVVMPDHLHWLLELRSDKSLGRVVGYLKGRTARRINIARRQTTKVWQPGFHDRALRRTEDLHEAGYYILNNPVRAGLVSDFCEYALLYAAWL